MSERDFEIIGAPFDLTSHTRGCALAPATLREAGLAGRLNYLRKFGINAIDSGDVLPSNTDLVDSPSPHFLEEFLSFGNALTKRLTASYHAGKTPFVVGGDHAISIASVTAAALHLRSTKGPEARLGLVWVDAHPDLEIPGTSGSGNLHGMAAAHLLGLGDARLTQFGGFAPKVRFEDMVYIGLRDSSLRERTILRERGITTFSMSDVEEIGITELCRRVFQSLDERTDGFVVSFDMDAIDPLEAPGVQAPERGGLRFREARVLMERATASEHLISLELVELNPPRDHESTTVAAALSLIEAGLGATLL